MKTLTKFAGLFAISTAILTSSCSDNAMVDVSSSEKKAIIAYTLSSNTGRSTVDGSYENQSVVGLLWTPGDELGIFGENGTQHRYVKANQSTNEAKCAFIPFNDTTPVPVYAYYPYTQGNDGLPPTMLGGEIAQTQPMDNGEITGDYKYGATAGSSTEGYTFEFRHIFALCKVDIDATGSPLEGETLQSVVIAATRNNESVNIAGDFTFDATNGSYEYGADMHNTLTMKWENGKALNSIVTGYISLFPSINTGDRLDFTITTDRHIAKFSVNSRVDFKNEYVYRLPLTLAGRDNLTVTDLDGNPESVTGTFTCATYNVDGLPSMINSDGPGSSGTTLLAQRVNSDNKWDFFCVSEDFEYDSQLTSALSNYHHGTYRGTVGAGQIFGGQADTDGLNMFWKNTSGITMTNETFVEYTDKEGGLTSGANTCIKKGFRYYIVTLSDGTEIDVYITHMNTYSGSSIDESNKYVAAVHSQLKQVRDYMLANINKNHRPAIFMGDTNMRYTRHKIKELLIDPINADSNLEIIDPWVNLAWGNDFTSVGGDTYPLYGGKSLMVSDATGTNPDTDVIISEADGGLQKGEVVDKIFYINCKDAPVQLTAISYLRDTSFKKTDGNPLADHYPIVATFTYTTNNNHQY